LESLLNPPPVLKSQTQDFDFDWDFGVRAHAGIQFHRDLWKILATWTHFDTKAHDHGFTTGKKFFLPIWSDPRFLLFPSFVLQPEAKWLLRFNQADFALSRPSFISRYFVFEPQIAASAISIEQHMHIDYTRRFTRGFSNSRLKNAFKGIGILTGLDTRFYFGSGWNIFNTTTFSLYYGQFNLTRRESFTTDGLFPQPKENFLHTLFWKIAPALAMQMGLRWDYPFSSKRDGGISVKLAYDYQLFFSQNQFFKIIDNLPFPQIVENQGDLALTGGTFSLLFTF
ncbi:MAG: hypothetical protein HYZ48_02990, partial [Chlamydiales bacterium]|nr:hypothetical protein [Chlamydiales bacterium]